MTSIPILHSRDSVLGVRKPSGLPTQAPSGCESLESCLKEQLSDIAVDYLAFPHRLDRCVSGVVLVAQTKRAARLLSDQFATRKTKKSYLAVVEGHYATEAKTGDSMEWRDTVRKIPDQAKGEVCDEDATGAKTAVTQVQVLQRLGSPKRTILRLRPITGRMHQLRIQAASRGFPIVGDTLYTPGGTQSPSSILLHADSISFYSPKNGRKITVACPADDFDI